MSQLCKHTMLLVLLALIGTPSWTQLDFTKFDPFQKTEKVFFGKASWYGHPFHGRLTANGEVYDMHLYTAAHKKLKLGTYVEVTNLENGKRLVVKVNDRGPYIPGRHLDLSFAAAKRLGFVSKGVIKIRYQILKRKTDHVQIEKIAKTHYANLF